jgi:hypothetical protein
MLTIRAATSATGFVITDAGIVYNPDVVWLSGTTVRVAYSTGQGELAAELVLHDINVATGAHSKATIVSGAPVFVAQPTLTATAVPTTGISSTTARRLLNSLYQQPVLDPRTQGRISRPWYRLIEAITGQLGGTIDLSSGQVTGILQQEHGGTGTNTGITNVAVAVDPAGALDGDGMTATPLAVKVDGATVTINADNELETSASALLIWDEALGNYLVARE